MASAREKLQEASGAAANLPQLQAALDRKKLEIQELEQKAVTEKDVEKLRDGELLKLIQQSGCEMRTLSIGEIPVKRAWMSNDSALRGSPIGDPGQETPFQLVQWTVSLNIVGPMGSIYTFLNQISQMDRFIHTTKVDMRRSDNDENLTQLKMDFTLYDLVRKKAVKNGA
jgi:hypothetical protein